MDVYGGQHAEWNTSFSFSFKPPKLSTCKIVSTEIAKIKIDNITKYVIIMIREGLLPAGNKKMLFNAFLNVFQCFLTLLVFVNAFKNTLLHPPHLIHCTSSFTSPLLGMKFNTLSTPSDKPEIFWFLTIYDPRSSTEYQCGTKKNDGPKGGKGEKGGLGSQSDLYNALYGYPFVGNAPQSPMKKASVSFFAQKPFFHLFILTKYAL